MSLLPEFVIQTTIARGIQAFRKDHRFIDQLFRNLDQNSLQQIRTFIDTQAIDLAINYPRSTLKVPAIVILLKSEVEGQAYLGDSMGLDTPDEFGYDGGVEGEVLGGAGSVSSLSGEGKVVAGPLNAIGGTNNTIKVDTSLMKFCTDAYRDAGYTIAIVAGTGAGQKRDITANSTDTIMVSPNWRTIPDSTSVFEIRASVDEQIGEPSKLYDRRKTQFIERRGALYNVSYQVQVIGMTPESTIFLYAILKAIFTLSRIFMERNGLIDLKMSGTDFLPRAEYMPDLAYMRAMTLDFKVPFDIYEDLGPGIDTVNLLLDPKEPIVIDIAELLKSPLVQ